MDETYNHLTGFYTARDVARILGIGSRRVRAIAKERGVGQQTDTGYWWFRHEDIERLRPGPNGRPRLKGPH
jgi:hypothetical protein